MSIDPVTVELSIADQEIILAAIATVHDKLPFLDGLSAAERKRMCYMGDKSRSFVNKAVELATQNSELMPRCLDADELRRDLELLDALYPIMMSIAKLQELVEDTYRKVGSEVYEAARLAYKSARANGKNAGVNSSVEEMGRRFAQKSRKVTN
jgi:hypothetical protein